MSDARPLTLYLLRHGECRHNLEGRVAGQSDSPLTDRGRKQAGEAGALLAELEPQLARFTFFASPLQRASTTMEIVREAAGLAPDGYICDRRLAELDCGNNSFRVWSGIEAEMKSDPNFADRWTWRHPGGESLADLYARAGAFLASPPGNAVIVTHRYNPNATRALSRPSAGSNP